MRVLKYRMIIKLDDFTTYTSPAGVEEVTEKMLGKNFDYFVRRLKDDKNFWTQEVFRVPDQVISTKDAE